MVCLLYFCYFTKTIPCWQVERVFLLQLQFGKHKTYVQQADIYEYIYPHDTQLENSQCVCVCISINKIKVILPFWLFILNMYICVRTFSMRQCITANIEGGLRARSKRVKIKTFPDKFFYCIYSSVKLEYHVEILLHLLCSMYVRTCTHAQNILNFM